MFTLKLFNNMCPCTLNMGTGRGTRGGQVCQCTGAFWTRALGEQLALSRGPTEGAGEKLSPCTSFTVSTWHRTERGVRRRGNQPMESWAKTPSGKGFGGKTLQVGREAMAWKGQVIMMSLS